MASPIIELKNISVTFDNKQILSDFSLTIDRGDFVSITGPNGSGKTTLLRVILGLLRPDSGRVIRFDAEGRETRHLAIGYLPQKSNIDSHFPITVSETVRQGLLGGGMGMKLFGRMNAECRQLFDKAVEECGIREILDRPIGVLSGGQLQRTLLARAIVSRPELLVLDEPLSYVDKSFEQKIYDLMASIARHTTIILVSHEMTAFLPLTTNHLTL